MKANELPWQPTNSLHWRLTPQIEPRKTPCTDRPGDSDLNKEKHTKNHGENTKTQKNIKHAQKSETCTTFWHFISCWSCQKPGEIRNEDTTTMKKLIEHRLPLGPKRNDKGACSQHPCLQWASVAETPPFCPSHLKSFPIPVGFEKQMKEKVDLVFFVVRLCKLMIPHSILMLGSLGTHPRVNPT